MFSFDISFVFYQQFADFFMSSKDTAMQWCHVELLGIREIREQIFDNVSEIIC